MSWQPIDAEQAEGREQTGELWRRSAVKSDMYLLDSRQVLNSRLTY